MRAKHHYAIKKIVYNYEGDYFDFEGQTKKEIVMFTTNKRAKAEDYYDSHLYLECSTIYKDIEYPCCEIAFIRDY